MIIYVRNILKATMTRQDQIVQLYNQAFSNFGTLALWNMRPVRNPTRQDALAITEALRVEGNLDARALAFQIESLCHADQ